jgi:hypothetical protein
LLFFRADAAKRSQARSSQHRFVTGKLALPAAWTQSSGNEVSQKPGSTSLAASLSDRARDFDR